MPSPIGHALAGTAVHLASADGLGEARGRWRWLLLVCIAGTPDLDLLFRLVDGRNHHNGWTHSIGAALLAGALAWGIFRLLRLARPGVLGLAVGASWTTHVVLDYLNRDTHPPIGIQALWPFDTAYYNIPWPVLFDISRAFDWLSIRNNLIAVTWETIVLLPLVLWVARRRFGGWRPLVRGGSSRS